jgi:hypothetical protein
MTGLEIIEKYPLSINIIKEWYKSNMLKALTDKTISEEFAKYMVDQGIPNKLIIDTLENNPRMVFDIFDTNEVFIQININNEENSVYFQSKINDFVFNISFKSLKYGTRKEAEIVAIPEAFYILEQKLQLNEKNI